MQIVSLSLSNLVLWLDPLWERWLLVSGSSHPVPTWRLRRFLWRGAEKESHLPKVLLLHPLKSVFTPLLVKSYTWKRLTSDAKVTAIKVQIVSEHRVASFARWPVQEEETGSPLMLEDKSFSHRGCHSYCEGGFGISKQSNLSQVNNLSERAHVHVGSYVRPSGRGGCTKVDFFNLALKWIWQF